MVVVLALAFLVVPVAELAVLIAVGSQIGYLNTFALMVVLSLAGAWLAHFAWNSPVLSGGFGLGTAGQIAAVLVKGIPALLIVLALVRAAGDREADYYARMLTDAGCRPPWSPGASRPWRRPTAR